jgi:hypothetical protein
VELLAHRAHRGYLFDATVQELVDIGIRRYWIYACSNGLLPDENNVFFCFVRQGFKDNTALQLYGSGPLWLV